MANDAITKYLTGGDVDLYNIAQKNLKSPLPGAKEDAARVINNLTQKAFSLAGGGRTNTAVATPSRAGAIFSPANTPQSTASPNLTRGEILRRNEENPPMPGLFMGDEWVEQARIPDPQESRSAQIFGQGQAEQTPEIVAGAPADAKSAATETPAPTQELGFAGKLMRAFRKIPPEYLLSIVQATNPGQAAAALGVGLRQAGQVLDRDTAAEEDVKIFQTNIAEAKKLTNPAERYEAMLAAQQDFGIRRFLSTKDLSFLKETRTGMKDINEYIIDLRDEATKGLNAQQKAQAEAEIRENMAKAFTDAGQPDIAKLIQAGVAPSTAVAAVPKAGKEAAEEKPIWDPNRGAWIYRPTPENPTGREVPLEGKKVPPKLTEVQSNAVMFGIRAKDTDKTLEAMEKGGYDPTGLEQLAALKFTPSSLTNWMASEAGQKYVNAGRNFVAATLRKESGAAITNDEWENGTRLYIPMPGDKPDVLGQKKRNRELVIKGLKTAAGRGADTIEAVGEEVPFEGESGTGDFSNLSNEDVLNQLGIR